MDAAPELDLIPLTPHLGAEVVGLDLNDLTQPTVAALQQAFRQRRVLVFRDQLLDREAHKRFGRHFGELQTHPAKTHLGLRGDPEIFSINISEKTRVANGELWHTDLSCEPVPPAASALYITETPASGGGDTLFANMVGMCMISTVVTVSISWCGEPLAAAFIDLSHCPNSLSVIWSIPSVCRPAKFRSCITVWTKRVSKIVRNNKVVPARSYSGRWGV